MSADVGRPEATIGTVGRFAARVQAFRHLDLLIFGLILVAGSAITWMRVLPGQRDRVWAEDANIFLAEALQHGPWAVLFEGYAGYQHFVPRLIVAVIFPFLELARYPVVVFAICAVFTGLTAAAVYWLSRDLVPWRPARITLSAITLLIPLAAQETIGNLADLHTYAMWLVPWLLLYRPRTWWTSSGWAVVMWALVMTEIQAVFFVFLILFRLSRRHRLQWPVFAGFVIGAAGQLLTAVSVERVSGSGPLSIPSTVMGWMINTVFPILTGSPFAIRDWLISTGLLVGVLILIPIIVATVYALVRGSGAQRLLVVTMLLGSAATYAGSAWANSSPAFMYAEEDLAYLGITLVLNIRYGVASGMMLLAVVPVALAIFVRRAAGGNGRWILGATACLILIGVLAHGSTYMFSLKDQVGPWSLAVDAAVIECETLDGETLVSLPVAPDRDVEIACEDVLQLSPR